MFRCLYFMLFVFVSNNFSLCFEIQAYQLAYIICKEYILSVVCIIVYVLIVYILNT